MNPEQIPVKIYCPLMRAEEVVFFNPKEIDGQLYGEFVGCDHLFSKCQECDDCHREALRLLKEPAK